MPSVKKKAVKKKIRLQRVADALAALTHSEMQSLAYKLSQDCIEDFSNGETVKGCVEFDRSNLSHWALLLGWAALKEWK